MEPSALVMSGCLIVLAVAHSFLGEREILQPLFRSEWAEPKPRWAMERILRFAWHLTSIAWLAMAAAVVGAPLSLAIAGMSLASAAIIFFSLRGHLAWPLFALAGVAGLHAEGLLVRPALGLVAISAVVVALGAAAIHLYWAGGGTWGGDVAIPGKAEGRPQFRPGPLLTVAVAGALVALGGLTMAVFLGGGPVWARWLLVTATVLLTARAIGDGGQIGFSKSDRTTAFARWDDRLFTPLVVLLAFGSGAALVA